MKGRVGFLEVPTSRHPPAIRSPEAVKKLFDVVVKQQEGRNGGYTRITKIGTRRGDATEMCILEWVVTEAAPAAEATATTEAAE